MLMTEIKGDLNKWKDLSCSWIRRLKIVNMQCFKIHIYRLNAISIKPQQDFFVDIHRII